MSNLAIILELIANLAPIAAKALAEGRDVTTDEIASAAAGDDAARATLAAAIDAAKA